MPSYGILDNTEIANCRICRVQGTHESVQPRRSAIVDVLSPFRAADLSPRSSVRFAPLFLCL